MPGEDAQHLPDEVEALRAYLKKGGFLWADDAWGSYAWEHWLRELRNILPAAEYPLVDLPINHSIFRVLFEAPLNVTLTSRVPSGNR